MKFIGVVLMVFGALYLLLLSGASSLILPIAIITGVWYFFFHKSGKNKNKLESEKKISELAEFLEADYKHIFNTSGIALNKSNKTLFLVDSGLTKTYAFADIRKWSYEIVTGGQVTGGSLSVANGLSSAISNTRIRKQNANNSGLFIEVRDIDHPKWQIRFADGESMEMQLLRWMEILRQNINEGEDDLDKKVQKELEQLRAYRETDEGKAQYARLIAEDEAEKRA